MTRKTTDAYVGVFNFIEEKLFHLKPTSFMADNECGMRLGIKSLWPGVTIKRCLFHFKRAVNNKCTSLGMGRLLKNSPNARKLKSMLLNIPLLPAEMIEEGFDCSKKFAELKKLNQSFARLFSYFETQWMTKVSTHCT